MIKLIGEALKYIFSDIHTYMQTEGIVMQFKCNVPQGKKGLKRAFFNSIPFQKNVLLNLQRCFMSHCFKDTSVAFNTMCPVTATQ